MTYFIRRDTGGERIGVKFKLSFCWDWICSYFSSQDMSTYESNIKPHTTIIFASEL